MMNEADTRAELIDPPLKGAGWGIVEGSRIRREQITPGRLDPSGRRGSKDIADYVLIYRNQKLGVLEAKATDKPLTEGLGQAKRYAECLQARFAFSSNGKGFYQVDMQTGAEGEIATFPSPEQLWAATFAEENAWRDRFADVPLEDKGGAWQVRYYQYNAINAVLEAIAGGRDRILLTMATGTGKTAVAFQIAWKLFHSRWNLTDWRNGSEPTRRPRVLFLADRNILADQAVNAFSAIPEDAIKRISPAEIRKEGRVPKNASFFFTIFQTFMSGRDAEGNPQPYFGDYTPDFFDFIVIDECHRGGANDESTWRGILDYFAPAVQLGMTATPKRNNNVDTYDYFGEPVYVYSLKQGINDGFLTPFKVKQIATTLDDYVYTPDDDVIEGEVEEGKRYVEADFNKIIEIKEREKKRVEIFMRSIDPREKTLVFCATQVHALAVRDLINQMKTVQHPDYCVRVTANDGKIGDQFLRTFQDNEKTIPTILTTSQKLSTGVDALNVRNIVLMRTINSMIEFKQIIGRGTRLFDGKHYFTIYDFVKAYEHFNDPEWDGEPVEPEPTPARPPRPDPPDPPEGDPDPPPQPREKVKIRLGNGKERLIQHMEATTFWSPDGKPISAHDFIVRLFGVLPELFRDEDQLREIWSKPETRKKLLEGLEERGYSRSQLADVGRLINAENSDLFDVLAYIAYERPPVSREQRATYGKKAIQSHYADPKEQQFLDFVLNHYVTEGVTELDEDKLPHLLELKYHGIRDAVATLGTAERIRRTFTGFQKYLYTHDGM